MSDSDSRRRSKDAPADAASEASGTQTGRRDFLRYAGFTFAAVTLPDWLGCGPSTGGHAGAEGVGASSGADSLNVALDSKWYSAVRREDLLHLRFNFAGLKIDHTAKTISLANPPNPGVIVVEFAPQHIAEEAPEEPLDGSPPPNPPARPIDARIAKASRIGFIVPGTTTTLPFDLSKLLNEVVSMGLNVAPNALGAFDDVLTPLPTLSGASDADIAVEQLNAATKARRSKLAQLDAPNQEVPPLNPPAPPGASVEDPSQTSIELPYRVVLSPSSAVRFAHSPTPVQSENKSLRNELWTSRLARAKNDPTNTSDVSADETTRVPISVRGVATPDLAASPTPPATFGGHIALDATTRVEIVKQSSDFKNNTVLNPIHARRMLLSARGGTLDAIANFTSSTVPLLNWQHRASIGRDNYVRVEKKGRLFPWGHDASFVTISERKFLANPNGGAGPRTAYLWQQFFVIVRTPIFNYGGTNEWPMKSLRILTKSTPPIERPTTCSFFPTINGFAFRFVGEFYDLDDNVQTVDFASIFFPENDPNCPRTDFNQLKKDYETTLNVDSTVRNASDFNRQRVAYADARGPNTGKTTFETSNVTFGADLDGDFEDDFEPKILQTEVAVPSVRQFAGADQAVTMEFPDVFKKSGLDPSQNPTEVFLSLVGQLQAGQGEGGTTTKPNPLPVDFGSQSQRGGGFIAPSMNLIGLSRQLGPLSGTLPNSQDVTTLQNEVKRQVDALVSGTINPADFFGALGNTKLFGCFQLKDLFGGSMPAIHLPKFATETLDVIATAMRTVKQVKDAVQTLQSAGPALNGVLSDITAFNNAVDALIPVISAVPPSNPTDYIGKVTTALNNVASAIDPLQTDVANARKTNGTLLASARLPDSAFALADSLLRQAKAMLPKGGLPPEVNTALTAMANASDAVANLTSRFEWETDPSDITAIDVLGIKSVFFPCDGKTPKVDKTKLKITGEVRAHDVAGKPAGLDLIATLNNFDINLVGAGTEPTPYNTTPVKPGQPLAFMALSFDHLTFTTMAGQRPSVDVGFKELTFEGPISFLNELKKIIPLDGFGDPPGITLDAKGLHADFTLALPSLAIGVFSLENISLGAGFDIPFIGDPMTVKFHFSERQNPFHLTVSLLGGGGYFLMDLSLQGVVLIEAALEFGAEASIDLVVASGSVLIMAGIYFRYEPAAQPTPGVTLTGYVRIAGSMSVIGLITASVEMRLDLGYDNGDAFGKATISIEVSIMFFSASVDIHCEKRFGACNGDPTFEDCMGPEQDPTIMPPSPWDEYCAAFAA
jgi:hypothetical protein